MKTLLLALSLSLGPVGAAATATAGAAAAETIMLELRDGGILWGRVVGHTPEHLRFERLTNGGVVELPWSFLDPERDRELRLAYGYIEPEGEELLVPAERFDLVDGEDVVGVVVGRDVEAIWIKRAGGTLPLPLQRLAGASTRVQAPALEIYTREELYQRRVAELGDRLRVEGAEGAERHRDLARFCERILDFYHAAVHLERARELDPTWRPDELAQALDRVRRKAEHQEQWDYLKEADLLRARGQFAEAIRRLELFPELYANSPVLPDWERVQARALKGRERALREEVVRRWHYWVERHATTAARELDYQQVLGYAEAELSADVLASVHEEVRELAPEIEEGAVRALWETREKGRLRKASYGLGTWLLGEERARAALEKTAEDEEPARQTERDVARQELEERMRRYVEAQRAGSSARRQSDDEDPDAAWRELNLSARVHWTVAYYAENSGDMDVERVRFANCRECAGTGAKEVLYLSAGRNSKSRAGTSASGLRLESCPTCHRIGVVRRIQYR